ncbi:MAG TPA: LUD domain-containing protein [Thermomicrobiales bacterium]|jgi:L-lactate dehydrogenase complex protein LldG|nr:LUD domain-containing protein [Thermomicrobiales bacterium]
MTDHRTDASLVAFAERAGALGVRVERVPDVAAAATVIHSERLQDAGDVVLTGELVRTIPALSDILGRDVTVRTATSPAAVRDAPLAVTLARAAFAETGSVLLAEPDLADRSAGMLSRTLVVLIRTADLLPGLDDAAAMLRRLATAPGAAYATIMTGPSRTADIERVLTVGVQGPGRVVVVFIDRFD